MDNDLRYEIKIPLEDVPVYHIRSWVNLHPLAFRKAFPPRRVNNIYFDTQDYTSMQDHLDGVYKRSKLRLRWYGEALSFEHSQFEIKQKQGDLGTKRVFPLAESFDLTCQSWQEIQQTVSAALPADMAEMLASYRPSLFNHYQREYFLSAEGDIRLTIDFDHHAFDQRFSEMPNTHFPEPFHNVPLIEIKAPQQVHKEVARMLSSFPVRTTNFSKYLDGMLSILER